MNNKSKKITKKESQDLSVKDSTIVQKTAKDLAPLPDYKITMRHFYELAHQLEGHYSIFYQIWELGDPYFTEAIPTAALAFGKSGAPDQFLWNPRFWEGLDDYNRTFIICHECLHALLNHGYRSWQIINSDNRLDASLKMQIANRAMDVVINEMLVAKFGFEKKKVNEWEKYCWLETVFKDEKGVLPNQNFEYYYNLLVKMIQEGKIKVITEYVTIDDHSGMGKEPQEGEEPGNGEFIKKLDKALSDEEKQGLEERVKGDLNGKKAQAKNKEEGEAKDGKNPGGQQAGTGTGGWFTLKKLPIKIKHKWETIIKRWEKHMLEETFTTVEQWTRKARRIATLDSGELIIPSELELELCDLEKHRISVAFLLDVSGSCYHLAERFFKAARSLDKRYFDLHCFSFDTEITPIDLKSNSLRGGGGTSFGNIPPYIEKYFKDKNLKYPAKVFLISDGFGCPLNLDPKLTKRWHWFLTESNSKDCITKGCHIHELKDFE